MYTTTDSAGAAAASARTGAQNRNPAPVSAAVAPQCAPVEAGVLVPLFEDSEGEVHAVLTERSARLKHHGGEVALPGGKRDAEDCSIEDTALREAHEEVQPPCSHLCGTGRAARNPCISRFANGCVRRLCV